MISLSEKQNNGSNRKPGAVRLVALGGMDELGKNMWLLCLDNDWLLVDAGSAFPENEMLGIDMVIPDISYLVENKQKLRGIVLTHAHVDHIGALPFLLNQLDLPIYGSALTIEMTKHYLRDHVYTTKPNFQVIEPGRRFLVGPIRCELLRMTHDLPDACGLAVQSPQGWIVFTGDFKIDYTPLDGKMIDLARLGQLGQEGVLCLLSDSANVELKGSTFSEREMGKRLEQVISEAEERLIVHLGVNDLLRVQQLLWLASERNMQVQILSPALQEMIQVAQRAKALQLPPAERRDPRGKKRPNGNGQRMRQMVITTTAPGEPYLSPLLGVGSGRNLVQRGDTVLITGAAVPGSEKAQIRVVNSLYKQGVARVVEVQSRGAFSSHAARDELKLMLSLTRPRNLIPVHGEARQLVQHRELALELGWPEEQIHVPENGACVDFVDKTGRITEKITVGKLLVDGFGIGDIGGVVLRDRKQLAEDGLLIAVLTVIRKEGTLVCEPQLVSRGFVYERESDEFFDEVRKRLSELVEQQKANGKYDWNTLKTTSKEVLSKFVFEKTHRRPMILTMVQEVRAENKKGS